MESAIVWSNGLRDRPKARPVGLFVLVGRGMAQGSGPYSVPVRGIQGTRSSNVRRLRPVQLGDGGADVANGTGESWACGPAGSA
ncbi:hypothetical protein KNE206_79030 [Kitasatospora sp. NE20-6]